MADNLQIRLTDADVETLATLEAWYPGMGRTAIVRLALLELARPCRQIGPIADIAHAPDAGILAP